MELNKIHNIDCLEFMKTLPDKCIDLVLTDIPYGEVNQESNGLRVLNKEDANEVNFDLHNLVLELMRVCKGSGYIFCGWEQVSFIAKQLKENDLSVRVGFWEKTNPSPMNGQHIWLSGIEYFVFWKNKNATFNENCKNPVFRFPSGSSKVHPTEKPLELFAKLVKASSNEKDLVYDPFAGSGTTAIACKMLGRNYILNEISPEYCKIAEDRIKSISSTLF